MADHKLDTNIQKTVLPFVIQGTQFVSQIDTSVFEALHTESELFMNKYEMQRDGKSVLLKETFPIHVRDEILDEVLETEFEIAYHFVDEKFRSIVLSAMLYDHNSPMYLNLAVNPFSQSFSSRPAIVNRVCFSFYIGSKKYLISDQFYDIIDFEAQAFQQSTLSDDVIGLPLAQQIIEIMGVNK